MGALSAGPDPAGTPDPLPARWRRLPVRTLADGRHRLIIATTLTARLSGVGGLDGLPPDLALELAANAIHTLTVRFALDLIWRDREGGVLRVDRAVPRWRIRACRHAGTVIECAAGNADGFLAALERPPSAPPERSAGRPDAG